MASRQIAQLPMRSLLGARPRQVSPTPRFVQHHRAYHVTTRLTMPYKDDQDRQSLKPRPNDSTKSGSDLDPSDHEEASFSSKMTKPEEEKANMQTECNGSPLEFSGANKEISDEKDEKAGSKEDKKTKSGSPGSKKHGKVSP